MSGGRQRQESSRRRYGSALPPSVRSMQSDYRRPSSSRSLHSSSSSSSSMSGWGRPAHDRSHRYGRGAGLEGSDRGRAYSGWDDRQRRPSEEVHSGRDSAGRSGSRGGGAERHTRRSRDRGREEDEERPHLPLYEFALQNTDFIDPKHSIKKVPINQMPVQKVWNHLKDWQAKAAVHPPDVLRAALAQKRKVPETLLAAMLRLGVIRTAVPGMERYVTPIGGVSSSRRSSGRRSHSGDPRDHVYAKARDPRDPRDHGQPSSSSRSSRKRRHDDVVVADPRDKRN